MVRLQPCGVVGNHYGPLLETVSTSDLTAWLLFHRIADENTRARMPRGREALSSDEIENLRRWIDHGAEYQSH